MVSVRVAGRETEEEMPAPVGDAVNVPMKAKGEEAWFLIEPLWRWGVHTTCKGCPCRCHPERLLTFKE